MLAEHVIVALAALTGLIVIAATGLRGWQAWLDLKRLEIDRRHAPEHAGASWAGAGRIELADLKERLRKLEAIASGVDL